MLKPKHLKFYAELEGRIKHLTEKCRLRIDPSTLSILSLEQELKDFYDYCIDRQKDVTNLLSRDSYKDYEYHYKESVEIVKKKFHFSYNGEENKHDSERKRVGFGLEFDELKEQVRKYDVEKPYVFINESFLQIDLFYKNDKDFAKYLNAYKLPNLNKLALFTSFKADGAMKALMANSFPDQVNKLWVRFGRSQYASPIKEYFSQLIEISQKVADHLILQGFHLAKEHFEEIVNKCSHLNTLAFYECKIDSEGCKFDDQVYQIETIYFYYCGSKNASDWEKNKDRFKSIVKGISD